MAAIYTDGNFAIAAAAGAKRFSFPFSEKGDNETVVHEQELMQYFVNFAPLALSTPDKFLVNKRLRVAYLIGESALEDMGGGIAKWTRTFATIPPPRTEFESFSWTKPGLGAGALYSQISITSAANSSGSTVITASASTGLAVGDFCVIRYTAQLASGIQIGRQVFRKATAVSGNDITVDLIQEPASISTWLAIQKVDQSRDPIAVVVPCTLQYDYALPGVAAGVAKPDGLQINYPPLVLDADGKETETYGANSTPNRTSYLQDVEDGKNIIAEASTVRVWKGHILERLTRYVRAI